jgi:hypothetical protein
MNFIYLSCPEFQIKTSMINSVPLTRSVQKNTSCLTKIHTLLLHFNVKLFVIGLAYSHILPFCPTKLTMMVFIRDTAPPNILGGFEIKQHTAGRAEDPQIWFSQYLLANGVEYAHEKQAKIGLIYFCRIVLQDDRPRNTSCSILRAQGFVLPPPDWGRSSCLGLQHRSDSLSTFRPPRPTYPNLKMAHFIHKEKWRRFLRNDVTHVQDYRMFQSTRLQPNSPRHLNLTSCSHWVDSQAINVQKELMDNIWKRLELHRHKWAFTQHINYTKILHVVVRPLSISPVFVSLLFYTLRFVHGTQWAACITCPSSSAMF